MQQADGLKPVMVRAGAFGPGCPARDMIVSPNHRFLSGDKKTPWLGQGGESLIAVRELVDGRRVLSAQMLGVSYLHLLFNAHEVILADGTWTESFHPDDRVLGDMAPAQRQEVLILFPEIATMGAAQRFKPARPIQKSRFDA